MRKIVNEWLVPRVVKYLLILLFTPLLFHTISKFHSSTLTPYGSLFILCFLLPNLGIHTKSSIAHLILLPIIQWGSALRHSHASFELIVLYLPRVFNLHANLLLNAVRKIHSPFTPFSTSFILFSESWHSNN
jgi:hypothetical protein